MSYYPCALVDELYPAAHWRRETKEWLSTLSNANTAPDAEYQRTELLLMNYDPPVQERLF